ncbi:hypothetical protein KM043_003409 [Ampulex compressa]|nr:hypothetical protein KM043_003409 [Ampulex compressa]
MIPAVQTAENRPLRPWKILKSCWKRWLRRFLDLLRCFMMLMEYVDPCEGEPTSSPLENLEELLETMAETFLRFAEVFYDVNGSKVWSLICEPEENLEELLETMAETFLRFAEVFYDVNGSKVWSLICEPEDNLEEWRALETMAETFLRFAEVFYDVNGLLSAGKLTFYDWHSLRCEEPTSSPLENLEELLETISETFLRFAEVFYDFNGLLNKGQLFFDDWHSRKCGEPTSSPLENLEELLETMAETFLRFAEVFYDVNGSKVWSLICEPEDNLEDWRAVEEEKSHSFGTLILLRCFMILMEYVDPCEGF